MAAVNRPRQNPKLKVTIGSIKLSNPTILASGVLGVTGGGLIRAWLDGAGAVVTKTVGLEAREGHTGPRIVGLGGGNLMNAMGLPNPGIQDYLSEIQTAQKAGVSVIGSALGSSPEEYASVAEQLANTSVTAIELNVSCPHVDSLYLLGLHAEQVSQVVKAVIQKVGKNPPVWVKLPGSTDYPRLIAVAKAAEKAGAKAIVAINTLPALSIDIHSRFPILGGGIGGLSGPAIKPIAVRTVWELHHAGISIPIVGAGGVLTGGDVIEYLLAGASAVEIGTGVLTRGSVIFKEICEEIVEYLKLHQISGLTELTGGIHDIGAGT